MPVENRQICSQSGTDLLADEQIWRWLIIPPGGGGYCHIWAIWVCAAVKGMVFKQFTLG